jgi:hypothetical protein
MSSSRSRKRAGPIAKRTLRAGVFKHPAKPIWCICWHVNGRPRWREIGTRAAALRAFGTWRREVYRRIEQKKHERHVSFPKPFRSGPFEHPPGSGVWWIGYYSKESRPGDRSVKNHHRRREKIGSREAAEKAYADRIKQIRESLRRLLWDDEKKKKKTCANMRKTRGTTEQRKLSKDSMNDYWRGLRSDPTAYAKKIAVRKAAHRKPEIREVKQLNAFGNLRLIEARDGGLRKAREAAADPEKTADRLADKMRTHCRLAGVIWTEQQFEQIRGNLLREILERRELGHKKQQVSKRPAPIFWAAFREVQRGRTLREVTEKYLGAYYRRDPREGLGGGPDAAMDQMKKGLKRCRNYLRRNKAA